MTIQILANDLLKALRHGCERIEIAGSIRRSKTDPKDIELVAVPKLISTPVLDLFGEVVADVGENVLETILPPLGWGFDQVLRRNGPKYKRLRHLDSGACADLFVTDAACWGAIFTIRTGPGDFSKELVTRAKRLGMEQKDGLLWRVHRDGTRTVVPTETEEAYFSALGLPWIAPHERSVSALPKLRMVY